MAGLHCGATFFIASHINTSYNADHDTKEKHMLLTFIAKIDTWIKSYLRYRRTVRELSMLSNRDLYDLGINRADIEFLARKHSGAFKV
jgi:uncharacterized protein YjiS (DUF1127 family)